MIFVDTDILSALAKVGRLSLLFALFRVTRLQIVPGVFKEIAHSVALGRSYATEILSLISKAQIEVIALTQEETLFGHTLSPSLGVGERESIAIVRERKGICFRLLELIHSLPRPSIENLYNSVIKNPH